MEQGLCPDCSLMMVASTSMQLARTCMKEQLDRILKQLHHSIKLEHYDSAVQVFKGAMSLVPNAHSDMMADLNDKINKENREKYDEFFKQLERYLI
eukprot:1833460-Rhodomonas_salina.1